MAMLSQERLAPLVAITGDAQAALILHQDILRLGTLLMPVTATVEIALRNMVCDCLSAHFGVADWLLRPPAPFQWRHIENNKVGQALASARRAEYAKKSQAEKHALDAIAFPNGRPPNLSHSQRAKKRQSAITVSNGKVIAELTLYFWKKMYSSDYEEALWKPALKRTFPDKKLKRSDISPHLETIYQTRNRLAHHEPVYGWRMSEVLKSIDFVIDNLGAANSDGERSLKKLLTADLDNLSSYNAALEERIASYSN
ncbi:hypothetical protein [uncultured Marivita sp.]|uniref:hypothetical protein n=1 Tax=uncultured Marivita sp. TaxID=888080 RepID=UPI00262577AB|nr:hypothetical protein [uncultured Marivita sp.]